MTCRRQRGNSALRFWCVEDGPGDKTDHPCEPGDCVFHEALTPGNVFGQREALAALEHEQWSTWANGVILDLRMLTRGHNQSCQCAGCSRIRRWELLVVPYEALPEAQKDRDRAWADMVIRLVLQGE